MFKLVISLLICFYGLCSYSQGLKGISLKSYDSQVVFRNISNEILIIDSVTGDYFCDSLNMNADGDSFVFLERISDCKYAIRPITPDTMIYLYVLRNEKIDSVHFKVVEIPDPQIFTFPEINTHKRLENYVIDSIYVQSHADRIIVPFNVIQFTIEILRKENNILSVFSNGATVSSENKNRLKEISKRLKTGDIIIITALVKNEYGEKRQVYRRFKVS